MNLSQIIFIFSFFLVIGFYLYSSQYLPTKPHHSRKGYIHPKWAHKYYDTKHKRNLIYLVSGLSRTLLPIILFKYLHPCNAMIINQIIIDNIDPLYLVNINSNYYNRTLYQNWDKFFDLWGYFVSLLPVFFYYHQDFISYHNSIPYILILLFIYRLIGYLVWKYTNKREDIFIFFPDLYTSLYYAISFSFLFNIKNKIIISLIIIISIILKIKHEIYLHN